MYIYIYLYSFCEKQERERPSEGPAWRRGRQSLPACRSVGGSRTVGWGSGAGGSSLCKHRLFLVSAQICMGVEFGRG